MQMSRGFQSNGSWHEPLSGHSGNRNIHLFLPSPEEPEAKEVNSNWDAAPVVLNIHPDSHRRNWPLVQL